VWAEELYGVSTEAEQADILRYPYWGKVQIPLFQRGETRDGIYIYGISSGWYWAVWVGIDMKRWGRLGA